jgi:NADPH-dependent 2,4-dienoyl-CoA reductase/sulfur reductase-like enzyme
MHSLSADVAVVGAGPAGLAAAVAASEAGARVALLDESPRPGGQIWRHLPERAPGAARAWLERLRATDRVTLLPRCCVVDARAGFRLLAEQDAQPRRVEAGRLVIATGARELFLPFPGWTRPGIFGVGGAQALLKSGVSFRGRRVVVAGSGPLLLPVAAALAGDGARIVALAEQAPAAAVARFALGLWREPAKLVQALGYRLALGRVRYRTGTWVASVRGGDSPEAALLTDGRRTREVACDAVCVGYGLVPNLELARLLGCAVKRGFVTVDAEQQTSRPGVYCAGEPTGIGGLELALVEGEIAGRAAAGAPLPAALLRRRARRRGLVPALARAFALRPALRGLAGPETVVCRCEDVRLARLRPEWSTREAKLATRSGMGPCQGRVCGPALAFLFGWDSDSVRAPLKPASVATLAALAGDGGT